MLSIKDIQASYGYIKALKGVSMEVPKGGIVALLGANGSGKTTTLRTISGLIKATNGTIEYDGELISNIKPEKIVHKGIIHTPEGRQIFPEFTVFENLRIGTYSRKDRNNAEKDYDTVYEYFPILKDRKNQIAGTLSGGEQQMLAIGRSLMAKPKLLLLDEPSLGLAPLIVKEIFKIIRAIRDEEGATILLVEQNAYQALAISDYAYILETGKLKIQGKAADLRRNDEVKKAYLGGH